MTTNTQNNVDYYPYEDPATLAGLKDQAERAYYREAQDSGNIITIIENDGNRFEYKNGQLIKATVTGEEGESITYEFNNLGNPKKITVSTEEGTQFETLYSYDKKGQLKARKRTHWENGEVKDEVVFSVGDHWGIRNERKTKTEFESNDPAVIKARAEQDQIRQKQAQQTAEQYQQEGFKGSIPKETSSKQKKFHRDPPRTVEGKTRTAWYIQGTEILMKEEIRTKDSCTTVEYFEGTNLPKTKKIDTTKPSQHTTVTYEYNEQGHTETETGKKNGLSFNEKRTYDVNGNLIAITTGSEKTLDRDSCVTQEFDPKTHKLIRETTITMRGTTVIEYDPFTGQRRRSEVTKNDDGRNTRTEKIVYDGEGRVLSEYRGNSDGTYIFVDYSTTQKHQTEVRRTSVEDKFTLPDEIQPTEPRGSHPKFERMDTYVDGKLVGSKYYKKGSDEIIGEIVYNDDKTMTVTDYETNQQVTMPQNAIEQLASFICKKVPGQRKTPPQANGTGRTNREPRVSEMINWYAQLETQIAKEDQKEKDQKGKGQQTNGPNPSTKTR